MKSEKITEKSDDDLSGVGALSDRQLLPLLANGNSDAALRELMRRYGRLAYSAAYRISHDVSLSQETTQDAFLLLVRKAKSIGPSILLGNWLYRSAINIAKTKMRSHARRLKREAEFESIHATAGDDDHRWSEIEQLLDNGIASLSKRLRDPIVLCYLEGRSQREAAKLLHCSESSLSKRLKQAVDALRLSLAKHGVSIGSAALAISLSRNASEAAAGFSLDALITSTLGKAAAGSSAYTTLSIVSKIMSIKKTLAVGASLLAIAAIIISTRISSISQEPESVAEQGTESMETLAITDPPPNQQEASPSPPLARTEEEAEAHAYPTESEAIRAFNKLYSLKSAETRHAILQSLKIELTLSEVEDLLTGYLPNDFDNRIFEYWLRKDPEASLRWQREVRDNEIGSLLSWAEFDLDGALSYAGSHLEDGDPKKERILDILAFAKDPSGRLSRLSRLVDPEERKDMLRGLARFLPVDALVEADLMLGKEGLVSSEERLAFLSKAVERMADSLPLEALEYLPDLEGGESYEAALRKVMRALGKNDFSIAVDALEGLEAMDRAIALEEISRGRAEASFEDALGWAQELDTTDFSNAIAGIASMGDSEELGLLLSSVLSSSAENGLDAALAQSLGEARIYAVDKAALLDSFLQTRSEQMGGDYVRYESKPSDRESPPLNQALWKATRAVADSLTQEEGPEATIAWLDSLPGLDQQQKFILSQRLVIGWSVASPGNKPREWVATTDFSEEQKAKLNGIVDRMEKIFSKK